MTGSGLVSACRTTAMFSRKNRWWIGLRLSLKTSWWMAAVPTFRTIKRGQIHIADHSKFDHPVLDTVWKTYAPCDQEDPTNGYPFSNGVTGFDPSMKCTVKHRQRRKDSQSDSSDGGQNGYCQSSPSPWGVSVRMVAVLLWIGAMKFTPYQSWALELWSQTALSGRDAPDLERGGREL